MRLIVPSPFVGAPAAMSASIWSARITRPPAFDNSLAASGIESASGLIRGSSDILETC